MRLISPYSAAMSVPPVRNQVAPRASHSSTSSNSARTRSLAIPRILISYARGRFGTCTCPLVCGAHAHSRLSVAPGHHPPITRRRVDLGDTCLRGRGHVPGHPRASAVENEDCMSLRSHSGVSAGNSDSRVPLDRQRPGPVCRGGPVGWRRACQAAGSRTGSQISRPTGSQGPRHNTVAACRVVGAVVELEPAVGSDHHPDEQAGRGEGEERNADDERLGGQEADGDEEPEDQVGGGESPRAEVGGSLRPAGKKRVIDGRREPHDHMDPVHKAVTPGFRGASHGSPVVAPAAGAGTRSPVQPTAGSDRRPRGGRAAPP